MLLIIGLALSDIIPIIMNIYTFPCFVEMASTVSLRFPDVLAEYRNP
jgi:hypothetical protein